MLYLCLCLSVSVCVAVCLCLCLCLCVCLSVCLCLFVCLSLSPSTTSTKIIIKSNIYIAPNPTRLAQSTSQLKTRMNITVKTWNLHTPDNSSYMHFNLRSRWPPFRNRSRHRGIEEEEKKEKKLTSQTTTTTTATTCPPIQTRTQLKRKL